MFGLLINFIKITVNFAFSLMITCYCFVWVTPKIRNNSLRGILIFFTEIIQIINISILTKYFQQFSKSKQENLVFTAFSEQLQQDNTILAHFRSQRYCSCSRQHKATQWVGAEGIMTHEMHRCYATVCGSSTFSFFP